MTFGPLTSTMPSRVRGRAARTVSGSTTRHRDARQRLADEPAPRAGLEEPRGPVVERVDGDHRRALGHAVPLQRADAEVVLERLGEPTRSSFSAPAITSRSEPNCAGAQRRSVELEERRRRQQDRRPVALDQRRRPPRPRAGWHGRPVPSLARPRARAASSRTSGRAAGCRASGPSARMRKTWAIASTLESMLKCERTTPLGSPVLPLLKMIVAGSSTVGRPVGTRDPLEQPDRREPGERRAPASRSTGAIAGADVLEPDRLDPSGQLELGLLEEGPAGDDGPEPGLRPRPTPSPARPAVKFRLTDGPARRATPPGSPAPPRHARRQQDPDRSWPSQRGRRARASATAPASAPIHESSRASASRRSPAGTGCRRARRMNS